MREINTEDKRNQGQKSSQNQSDGDKFSKETIKRKGRRRCGYVQREQISAGYEEWSVEQVYFSSAHLSCEHRLASCHHLQSVVSLFPFSVLWIQNSKNRVRRDIRLLACDRKAYCDTSYQFSLFPCLPRGKALPSLIIMEVNEVKSLSHVQLFATQWTVAYQAPLSMGFSRQEYWSGLPFPSPGDLPKPGIKPGSPALQADVLTSELPGKPNNGRIRLKRYSE